MNDLGYQKNFKYIILADVSCAETAKMRKTWLSAVNEFCFIVV